MYFIWNVTSQLSLEENHIVTFNFCKELVNIEYYTFQMLQYFKPIHVQW